jgi:chromosomal replication initiator protein
MLPLNWDAAVDVIREALPPTQFQNWIRPLRFLRHNHAAVVLGVPSRFHEEWLRRNYAHALQTAIRNQCGADLQLEFEVLTAAHTAEQEHDLPPPSPGTTTPSLATGLVPAPSARSTRPTLRVVGPAGAADMAARTTTLPAPVPAPSLAAAAPMTPDAPEEADDGDPRLPQFQQPFFEVGANSVAYQCSLLFGESRVPTIPTLLIIGTTGLGKTHLLGEAGRWIGMKHSNLRVRYTSAEAFTNEQGQHYRTNSILSFKRRYADRTDVLLFDDIQGLAGRWKTQEVLLHCLNEIGNRGGRVAFTSNVLPQRLGEFLEPLRSRLLAGVVAELRGPTHEERTVLLQRMAEHQNLVIDPIALRLLAEQHHRDVRELFGALLRVHLQARLENRPLDVALVRQRSMSVEPSREERVSLEEIVGLVEHNFRVQRTDLVSKSRKGAVVWARQVAMYLARTYTLLPLEEIGRFFGRDHATVIHAFGKVKETMATQPTRRYEVEFLVKKLEAKR